MTVRRSIRDFNAGLAALVLRELALPYVAIAGGVAFMHQRKREAAVWFAGILLFALFLLWHAQQVAARVSADDEKIFSEGWLHLGGLRFVLLTGRMNRYLFAAPAWINTWRARSTGRATLLSIIAGAERELRDIRACSGR